MQKIGVIADDLTGATDVAAAFADVGFKALVLIARTGACADADVMAVSTDSRHLRPDQARRKVREAWRALADAGCQLVYKKMDSTVKGNIVAEVEALRRVGGYAKALVCPANPGQGRCIQNGVLTVRGEFFADLRPYFAGQGLRDAAFLTRPVTRSALTAALGRSVSTTLVADATCERDLAVLVRGALGFRAPVLLAGSAGLAGQLARVLRPRVATRGRFDPEKANAATLVLCGTRSPVTRVQIKCLVEESGAAIYSLQNARADRIESRLAEGNSVVINVPIYRRPNPLILRQLRQLTGVTHAPRPPRLLVTGGDTARLVCRWLKPAALEILGELLPGLAWGRIRGGLADGLMLCTKPGGFGDERSLVRAVAGAGRRL